jgi:chemotaxis protein histidine kinase CheA
MEADMSDGLDRNGFSPEEMAVVRNIFVTSSAEYIGSFHEALAAVKQQQYDDTVFEPLHRSIHSLKGAAMQLGFIPVGSLALAMETVIRRLRDCDSATTDFDGAVAVLESGEQQLKEYIGQLTKDEELTEEATQLITELETFGEQLGDRRDQ